MKLPLGRNIESKDILTETLTDILSVQVEA
jgi:hypothetical protein